MIEILMTFGTMFLAICMIIVNFLPIIGIVLALKWLSKGNY